MYSIAGLQDYVRHGMETLSALLALCEGNPPVTEGIPWKGPSNAVLLSLSTSSWTNSQVAGDSRRHDAYVTSL